MHLLVLIHEYPPVGGGGGKVARDVCQGLAARGHTIRLLTSAHASLAAELSPGPLQILRLGCWRQELFRASLESMILYVLRSTLTGIQAARRERFDLIHAHFAVPAGAAAWMISKACHIPYVLTAHLGDVPGGTPEKTDRWFRWIYPFTKLIWKDAAGITAVSEYTRGLAHRHYPVPIEVIPNGIENHLAWDAPITPNKPAFILFSARFMQQKNPLLVARILAGIRDLPWQAAMLGDGPLRPAVEGELNRLGILDRVVMTGWVTPEVVQGWMGRGDILLMPSQAEGLSMTGLQAKANGLALVLSRTSGNMELIQSPGEGYLVTPGDTEGYTAALRSLLSVPEHLREMRCASLRSARRYDLDRVIDRYEQFFFKAKRGKISDRAGRLK